MRRISFFAACLTASASLVAQTPVRQMTITPTVGEAQTFIVNDINEITFSEAGSFHAEATANDAERGTVKSGYYNAVGDIAIFYATPNAGYRLSHWTVGGTIVVQTNLKVKVTADFNDLEIQAVFLKDNKYNGHSYVDIFGDGSVLWATHNVGATNPEDFGDYFAWGEVKPNKPEGYKWSTYKWGKDEDKLEKYNYDENHAADGFEPDNKLTLDPADDAAKYTWGAEWRMPTNEEQIAVFDNLEEKLIWYRQIAINDGQGRTSGYIVQNAADPELLLFLPAAGNVRDTGLNDYGVYGYYWSSTLHPDEPERARLASLQPSSQHGGNHYGYRYYGRSIRPVVVLPAEE